MSTANTELLNNALKILVGFLLTVTLSVSGWSLKQHFSTNDKLVRIETTLTQIQNDKDWKTQKDEIDKMHWKYNSWSREHINRLYQFQGKELPPGPNLD